MKQCPHCQSTDTKVVKTIYKDNTTIRYKKCRECMKTHRTVEYFEEDTLQIKVQKLEEGIKKILDIIEEIGGFIE